MARIESLYAISGTYGNLVVYKVGSQLYARTKSTLDGNRFRKDKAFTRSRERARQFGQASRLAKTIYASLPKEVKCKGLFGKLTAFIAKGLQEGKTKTTLEKEFLKGVEMATCREVVVIGATKTKSRHTFSSKLPLKEQQEPSFSNWKITAAGSLVKGNCNTTPFAMAENNDRTCSWPYI